MTPSGDSDLVAGGFIITRPVVRESTGSFMDPSLVPEKLWTASRCLARMAPDAWAIEWTGIDDAERLSAAADFGIPPERLPEVIQWVTRRFELDFGWEHVFLTLDAAREFCATFLPSNSDAAILGLSLSSEDVEEVIQWLAPGPGEGAPGLYQCLTRRQPPPSGGERLGSDVLGVEHGGGSFHSFLCNGLERDFAEKLGARPNSHGLFDDHSLARRCASLAGRDDIGAEPVPWRAWALSRYPRT